MSAAAYKFQDHVKVKNSKYIFQSVTSQKLSNIYHRHEFHEVILILEGTVTHKINTVSYPMQKGDCVILTPKDEHSFTAQSEDMKLIGLSVLNDEILALGNIFGINPLLSGDPILFSCANRLRDIETQAVRCCNVIDDNENKLLLSLVLSIYKTARNTAQIHIPQALAEAVSQMENSDNLKEGVAALVKLSNYSYPHLYRLMRQYYRVTPHDLVFKLRLDTAYSMLLQSDMPVEEIAENVGFMSVSHFNKVFCGRFGVTPAKLRKRYASVCF